MTRAFYIILAPALIVFSFPVVPIWPRKFWPIQVIVIAAGACLLATVYIWQKRGRGK